jgi:hypothetical protein
MSVKFRILAITVGLIGCAALVRAEQPPLSLRIANGRVSMHAQNVPVRTILAEWARLGGAKIVNGDRVVGAPVTLDLENVPERQALDIVLRGVSGYMLAAREAGAPGASMFDRIMILPTSNAPRNPPPAGPVLSNMPAGIVRPVMPRQPDDQEAEDAPQDVGGSEGGVPRPVVMQRPPTPFGGLPGVPPIPIAPDGNPQQTPPGVVTTPSNPFGLPPGASVRPGVIAPAQPQPGQAPPRVNEN